MKIQHHRTNTNVVVGLLVREFYCSGSDVSAKVLAMYAGTRTPTMEPQWLAAGLSQRLPDVVFWNVASRNCQQPVTMNEQGVQLVSGVTPQLFSLIAGGNYTPYSFMIKTLMSERYEKIVA